MNYREADELRYLLEMQTDELRCVNYREVNELKYLLEMQVSR